MAATKRIYYAIKQLGIKTLADSGAYDGTDVIYGVQDATVGTNYNLSQVFEWGQLEVYENFEELPDVEISVTKVIDGKPLVWHMATREAQVPGPTLGNRSNARCNLGIAIFPDTNDSAVGTPNAIVEASGLYPQSLTYTFGVDGPFTEQVTFVGNDKIYNIDPRIVNTESLARAGALTFPGQFASNNDVPSGIERRSSILFDTAETDVDVNGSIADMDVTILPYEVAGIRANGTNPLVDGHRACPIQNITISTNLGRESINALGSKGPYHRYATFPVEVTTAIEAISVSGDLNSATELGIYATGEECSTGSQNLKDRTIRIATCGGLRIYLGPKNRLQSTDFAGGSSDGGNDTNSYQFINYNRLTVMADYDPHPSADTWWTNRDDYLLDV